MADALPFEHKYTSGVLAWAPEDTPPMRRPRAGARLWPEPVRLSAAPSPTRSMAPRGPGGGRREERRPFDRHPAGVQRDTDLPRVP